MWNYELFIETVAAYKNIFSKSKKKNTNKKHKH